MRTVLVGTDFSKGSDRAFAKACELAQRMGERVHLLHVVEPVDDPESPDPDTRKFYEELLAKSEVKLEAEMTENTRPVEVTCSVEIGHRAPTIHRVAEALGADLVVLGSNPLKEDSMHRLGVGHRVALTSTRPVLLIP